jgi:DNA-binding MarR family transcriptional regulator
MSQERYENLLSLFWSVHRKLNYLLSMNLDYGVGFPLSSAEIHTIEAVGKNPGINLTELAGRMVVTKGAMSQTLRRLEKRGLLRREKRAGNRKEVIPALTKLGRAAFQGHERFHLAMDQQMMGELENMSQSQYRFLREVFAKLDQGADDYLKALG